MKHIRPHELRVIRKELGLTQAQLGEALLLDAAATGTADRTISLWESGRRKVPGPAAVAIGFMLSIARGELRPPRVRKPKA